MSEGEQIDRPLAELTPAQLREEVDRYIKAYGDAAWEHDLELIDVNGKCIPVLLDEIFKRIPGPKHKLPDDFVEVEPEATMVKINGKTWRCSCGCNVLTKYAVSKDGTKDRYRCNGCGAYMEGEKP